MVPAAYARPELKRADQVCEAILALSGTTNGRLSVEGFKQMEERTGVKLADLSEERGEIGGYAQLSYGFNYYGPTGSQRDELTLMRKRESEVVY